MNLQVVEKKRIWFFISGAVILIGLAMMLIKGFNLGIDFTGGTLVEINTHKYIEEAQVREITNEVDPKASISYAGDEKEILQIRTMESLDNAGRVALFEKFREKYSLDQQTDLVSSEQFGAAVGKEIQRSAVLSIIIATVFMLLYITFRFKFSFGLASIMALVHDVLIVLSIYVIFRIPVNNPFVAAMLTVVGYSINDTIVIFDRIRENLKTAKRNVYQETAETSVNQSVTRSINTSVTTLLAITALFVVGVDSIREFTLPLMAGIAVGTYSSIFVASPLWVMIKERKSNW
ncbi:MAG: protein translocase subunit SecF [Peptostreptococcaceae bacterium]|nr:protein translocase subunit SecF [Peptostreptococcaceae bacterium]